MKTSSQSNERQSNQEQLNFKKHLLDKEHEEGVV